MDVNLILNVFSGTLQSDQSTRRQAESTLKELAGSEGFLEACVNIIGDPSPEINPGVKIAAAVYLKNRVVKYWNNDASGTMIPQYERQAIKDRILNLLNISVHNTRRQLITVLRILVSFEYPRRWPNLLNQTGSLLQQVPVGDGLQDSDYTNLYTGLVCLAEIARKYRWVDNQQRETELDPIIESVFPHLLNIGASIISNSEKMTELTSEMLKIILKIYKFVTYFDLPVVLQKRESLVAWGDLHGSIINLIPPAYIVDNYLSEEERSVFEFSKCYKWSIANLYRLFTRYGSKSLSKKFNYDAFQYMFVEEFIPPLISNYLKIIELYCSGSKWLSLKAISYLLQFLSHCVTQKSSWNHIKPYFETIISHFVYPFLCPSNSTLQTFESDPNEYINSYLNMYDIFDSPDVAAIGFLVTLVDKRKTTTLEPIVHFVYSELSSLSQQEEDLDVAKKKDGSFRLLGGISHFLVIPKSPYFSQLELLLKNLVFPSLHSKFDFLRARTLEVASNFADLEFKDQEALTLLFEGILSNFTSEQKDSCLPVDLKCALAIQSYLQIEQFRQLLAPMILPIMSKLLHLSNDVDNDAVSMVIQECVENFPQQLQPFGVDLMSKLVEQFMRLAREINHSIQAELEDEDEFEDQSEKVMAADGLINTMVTVLLSFETSKEICVKLEEVFMPAVQFVLSNKIDDFFTEVGELIENTTFLSRTITPIMWSNFELMYNLFTDGIGLMYLEDLVASFKNFLVFGSKEVASNDLLKQSFCNIVNITLEGDEDQIGLEDSSFACEIAQAFILSLQEASIPYIAILLENIIKLARKTRQDKSEASNSVLNVNINDTIVAGLVYDPSSTILMLEKNHLTVPFLNNWLKQIPLLTRVYDIKLSIIGLISLVSNDQVLGGLDNEIVSNLGRLFVLLFQKLPKAIEQLERKRKNFDDDDFHVRNQDSKFEDFDEDDSFLADNDLEQDTEASEHIFSSADFKIESSGFMNFEDQPIEENPLEATALDGLNIEEVFRHFVNALKSDVNRYNAVFGSLNENELKVIQQAF